MKTKKETAKKTKVASKVRTVSLIKKSKTAVISKHVGKKSKTIAASKLLKTKTLSDFSPAKQKIIIMYRLKRLTYMILAILLGMLSAGFMLGILEQVYLANSSRAGMNPATHQFLGMHLFLLPIVYVLIFGAGIYLGAWLGFWGWRMVYIEHRHPSFQKK